MARKRKNANKNANFAEATPPKKNKKDRYKYRRKQRNTSIYFLLWAVFSGVALFVVLLCGITQHLLTMQLYKTEARQDVLEKGQVVKEQVLKKPPVAFGDNFSGYLRFLSMQYDVEIFILNENGDVLFPLEESILPDSPEVEEEYDFSEEITVLLRHLQEQDGDDVVYEGAEAYVYGARIPAAADGNVYLYVEKSFALLMAVSEKVLTRVVAISVFVFVLSFAISSVFSGWLTKPISEMAEKARLMAYGNFDVDFHGVDYGQEMVELADALNFARDELSKTDSMQKELIANVSHDFKTPLTMIKAYASMIVEISGDNPEKRNKHANVIVSEADRLTSLVNDLLDLSKIRSGLEVLKNESLDMSAYTLEILERFAYLRETQGYRFEVDVEEGLYTRADEVKIGQVLYNLIGNAVNYTGENKTVRVCLKKESDKIFRFSVTDTGNGIKPEELGEVWDRYYRSKETHKRPVQGTGLGLTIVKTILEKHMFHFGVNSKVGEGSTFYVLFPLEEENV